MTPQQQRFAGKVALVTGGTRGIGFKVAQGLAEQGARVVLLGRSEETGRLAENSLNGAARFIQCDVSDVRQVEGAFESIAEHYGGIDCAFNNAGITSKVGLFGESDVDNWHAVIGTNLNGTYYCMRRELDMMSRTGGGAIVNNSSCATALAIGGQVAYVASKNAINGMTEVAAIDYATEAGDRKPVRVNAVAPGPILGGFNSEERLRDNPERTQLKIKATAMKRLGTLDEVANAVLWLLSDEASYVTGTILLVDGGFAAGKF